jgi:hyaluronoglucosaminidase
MIERMGAWGMNVYVYAPKNDPLHRDQWREPYPEPLMREFGELVECGASAGVRVGFALSPGLSIRYASSEERAALLRKLRGFRELGSSFLSLALDDVPEDLVHDEDRRTFSSLAAAHVSLTNELASELGSDVTLWLVPTDYIGVEASPYLEELGEGLASGVEVGWTGRTVVSPAILTREAARRAETLRRPLLVWDNIPVSDGGMRSMLHAGPYAGREPGLERHLSGILLNPMEHARASGVNVRAAAFYLSDPDGYDPEWSWGEAVRELGDGDPEALAVFLEAHRFHPASPEDRDRELEAGLRRLESAVEQGKPCAETIAELRSLLELRLGCGERLREGLTDRRLYDEIEPWVESHRRETRRIAAAVDALDSLLSDAPATLKALAFLALGRRVNLDATPVPQSYGPRRIFYPQFVRRKDQNLGFGSDPPLYRDRCLADEFVTLAERIGLSTLSV